MLDVSRLYRKAPKETAILWWLPGHPRLVGIFQVGETWLGGHYGLRRAEPRQGCGDVSLPIKTKDKAHDPSMG